MKQAARSVEACRRAWPTWRDTVPDSAEFVQRISGRSSSDRAIDVGVERRIPVQTEYCGAEARARA